MKKLIEYLGTPRLYAELFQYLAESGVQQGVFLRQLSSNRWSVEETLGLLPKAVEYPSREALMQEFGSLMSFSPQEGLFLAFEGDIPETEQHFIQKVLEIHQKMSLSEGLEKQISKLSYNITGIETLLGTLFEPVETMELLQILTDSVGELLLSSSVLFYRTGNFFRPVHTHGDTFVPIQFQVNAYNTSPLYFSFPVQMPQSKLFPESVSLDYPGSSSYAFPILEEDQVTHFILLWRKGQFQEEELQLLSAASRLIARVIEFNDQKLQITKLTKLLQKSEYHLLSLHKSLEVLFSSETTSDFADRLHGILKEVYPNHEMHLYTRRNWSNLIWPSEKTEHMSAIILKQSEIWDLYDLRDPHQRAAFLEDFGEATFIDNYRYLHRCAIIRSTEGTVLGLILSSDMDEESLGFLRSIASMAGIALRALFSQVDLQKTLSMYENCMNTIQTVRQLVDQLHSVSNLLEVESQIREKLVDPGYLADFWIMWGEPPNHRTIPEIIDAQYLNLLESNQKTVSVKALSSGNLVYMIPVKTNQTNVTLFFSGEDQQVFHLVVQILSMVLPDTIIRKLVD